MVTNPLLIPIVLLILCSFLRGFYAWGYRKGAKSPKSLLEKDSEPKEIPCYHVWGKWEQGSANYYDTKTGQKLYPLPTQSRTCDTCGFLEKIRVRPHE